MTGNEVPLQAKQNRDLISSELEPRHHHLSDCWVNMRINYLRSRACSPTKDIGLRNDEVEFKVKEVDVAHNEKQVLSRKGHEVGPSEDCDS